jgi:hypothetical protein
VDLIAPELEAQPGQHEHQHEKATMATHRSAPIGRLNLPRSCVSDNKGGRRAIISDAVQWPPESFLDEER